MTWKLYDELIAGIPEEVLVRDYCLGLHWSYVESESGMGVAYTCRGGAKKSSDPRNFRGLPLRELASLAKSWRFEEATLGIAALNSWYGRPELINQLNAHYDQPVELPDGSIHKLDAFELLRPRIEAEQNAHVVVVGHFPHVDRICEYAQLTVLERNCGSELDTPDPACEYCLPGADYAFITGVTLENKTAPRLLKLAQDTFVTMLGPSVVMAKPMFKHGVNIAAGSIAIDPEQIRYSVMSGGALSFGGAIQMVTTHIDPKLTSLFDC